MAQPEINIKNVNATRLIVAIAVLIVLAVAICWSVPSMRGAISLQKGDWESALGFRELALSDYQTAAEAEPNNEAALERKGSLLHEAHQNAKAIAIFKHLSELPSPSAKLTAVKHLAQLAIEQKDFPKALRYTEKWLALEPKSAAAYHIKGLALGGMNKFEPALDALEISVKIDPLSGAAIDRDELLQKARVSDTFMNSVFQPKLENKSNDYESQMLDILRLQLAGNDAEGIAVCTSAIKNFPDKPAPLFLRAWLHLELKQCKEAIPDFLEAERLSNRKTIYMPVNPTGNILPSHAELYEIRCYEACAYLCVKDYENALSTINTAIAMRPDFADYYKVRSQIYKAMGKFDLERLDLAQAARRDKPKTEKNVRLREPVEAILQP